jgi:peptidoglycan/LPS O-acetylase OafA/YrhL
MVAGMDPVAKHPAGRVFHLRALDGLRGLAALYVLLHHTSSNELGLQRTIIGQPFRFGLEAVLIFFFLSGFLISYSQESRGSISWKRYAFSRVRRIYPIFVIALGLAYLVNSFKSGGFHVPDLVNLIGNLAMLQDVNNKPGVWFVPFEGNYPLWSLAYEIFFYFAYMIVMVGVPRRFQTVAVGLVTGGGVLVNHFYPNHVCNCLVLFPIWWCGLLMSREMLASGCLTFKRQLKGVVILIPGFLYYLWVLLGMIDKGSDLALAEYPIFQVRFLGESIILMLSMPLLVKIKRGVALLEGGAVVWLGGISYALYALHFPILCGLPDFGGLGVAASISVKFALIFLLSWVVERGIQPWINRKTQSWV